MSSVKPHSYQQEALDFCLQRMYVQGNAGAGLFLDPGLGKTLITLLFLEQMRDLGEIDKALIVAPLRVCKLVWGQEIKKWQFDFRTNMLCQRAKQGLKSNRSAFIDLINPESLHHLIGQEHRYDFVGLDESTKFKNWSSNRTKAARKICPKIKYRLALTGTPAPNSLADLHAQMYLLDEGDALGRNVTVFRSLYMHQGGWQGRQWFLRNGQEKKIEDAVAPMVLRLDAESNLDMPKLMKHDMICELPNECVREYAKLKKELYAQLNTGNILAMNAASAYMKMRQFANGMVFDTERVAHHVHNEKVEMLHDLVNEIGGKPVLVFYQFSHDVGAIQKKFKKKLPVLSGATKSAEAQKILDDWNAGKIHVLLVQNMAASHGLNMQGSGNHVVYFGLNDQLEVFEQSYRRIYRQGVKGNHVYIYRLLTRGTVDTVVADRLDSKDQTQRDFMNSLKEHARGQ